jgi:predicted NUDIX family NTP pyrophosphohydrolase
VAAKRSAGILLYRVRAGVLEVFLVHPGGPFWAKKDAGAWSLPKGEFEQGEDPLEHAKREFLEETGSPVEGRFLPLSPVKLKGGKTIFAWAVEGDIDADAIRSNLFPMEWPPRSGRRQEFPEVDRGGWFDLEAARTRLQEGQLGLLGELEAVLGKCREATRLA